MFKEYACLTVTRELTIAEQHVQGTHDNGYTPGLVPHRHAILIHLHVPCFGLRSLSRSKASDARWAIPSVPPDVPPQGVLVPFQEAVTFPPCRTMRPLALHPRSPPLPRPRPRRFRKEHGRLCPLEHGIQKGSCWQPRTWVSTVRAWIQQRPNTGQASTGSGTLRVATRWQKAR